MENEINYSCTKSLLDLIRVNIFFILEFFNERNAKIRELNKNGDNGIPLRMILKLSDEKRNEKMNDER